MTSPVYKRALAPGVPCGYESVEAEIPVESFAQRHGLKLSGSAEPALYKENGCATARGITGHGSCWIISLRGSPQFLAELVRQFATYALGLSGLVWFSRALNDRVRFIIRTSKKMQVSHVSSSSTVVPKLAARHATQVSAKRVVAAAAKASPQTSDDKIQLGKSGAPC